MQAYQPYRIHQIVEHAPLSERIDFDILLFINTKSGGQTGMRFMALEMQTARFIMHGLRIDVSFFNLNDNNSTVKGLQMLKKAEASGHACRAIVCGGDGTVLWVVKEIVDYGIPIHNIPIGVIPIGTGNDFSREMGWGGKQQKMIGEKFQKLKELVFEWIDAQVVNFDVWEMTMTLHDTGVFKKVKGKTDEVMDHGVKVFRKSFTNYCSIGIDGRIGYSFDKHRGKSRAMNMVIYAYLGMIKACGRTPKMNKFVHSMNQIVNQPAAQSSFANSSISPSSPGENTQRTVIQPISQQTVFNNEPDNLYSLKPGYENIVALNINSFMGGCNDMWYTKSLAVTSTDQRMYGPTRYDDGILQFVAWKSEMGLACQRCLKTGAKVAQGPGPFIYTFNPPVDEDAHTYLQIDGEFYKAYHPKEMIYRKCTKIPGGYIKVLKYRGRKRKDFMKPS